MQVIPSMPEAKITLKRAQPPSKKAYPVHYDEAKRGEYLSGFRKRKKERQQIGYEQERATARHEKILARRDARKQMYGGAMGEEIAASVRHEEEQQAAAAGPTETLSFGSVAVTIEPISAAPAPVAFKRARGRGKEKVKGPSQPLANLKPKLGKSHGRCTNKPRQDRKARRRGHDGKRSKD